MSNNIMPTPWTTKDKTDDAVISIIGGDGCPVGGLSYYGEDVKEQCKEDAKAIVSAVNNTYGRGINPEAVGDLLEALKEIDAIWGKEWGWANHPAFLKAKAAIEKAKL